MARSKTYDKAAAQAQAQAQETAAAIREGVKQSMQTLADEMSQGKSERLMKVLAFSARFHKYSPMNQLAIQAQRPEATHVAGYRTWEKMGYHVAKGQRGIRIFAPRPYKVADTESDEEITRLTFTTVAVFDASQLNADELAAKPLPSFFGGQGSDEQSAELAERLVAAMRASGITVREVTDLPGDVQGQSGDGLVELRKGQESRARCNTAAHEWAHELLHQGAENAEQKARGAHVRECHAEATAYVVCNHFGVPSAISSDYLLSWANTPETLMRELELVQKAAATIIAALEPKSGEEEEAA